MELKLFEGVQKTIKGYHINRTFMELKQDTHEQWILRWKY